MRTFQRIRRSIALFLLLVYLPACHSWKPVPVHPVLAEEHPGVVRVTTTDAGRTRRVTVSKPVVKTDTLMGFAWGTRDSVRIPLASVVYLEQRQFSWSKTTFAFLPLALFGALVIGCAIEGDCFSPY